MLKLVCGYAVASDTATLHTVWHDRCATCDHDRRRHHHRQSCNARAGTQCYSLRVAS